MNRMFFLESLGNCLEPPQATNYYFYHSMHFYFIFIGREATTWHEKKNQSTKIRLLMRSLKKVFRGFLACIYPHTLGLCDIDLQTCCPSILHSLVLLACKCPTVCESRLRSPVKSRSSSYCIRVHLIPLGCSIVVFSTQSLTCEKRSEDTIHPCLTSLCQWRVQTNQCYRWLYSFRLRQIIYLLSTDKSRYFVQPRPVIVIYFRICFLLCWNIVLDNSDPPPGASVTLNV